MAMLNNQMVEDYEMILYGELSKNVGHTNQKTWG
jgi:hypothetical protein